MSAHTTALKALTSDCLPARVDAAVDVRHVRQALGLSQQEFAARFGFSVAAVRHWEQGRREPEAAARTLLRLIDKDPNSFLEMQGAPVAEEPSNVIPREEVERARRLLVRAYFGLRAERHHCDEISEPTRDMLLRRLAEDMLAAMSALGLVKAGGVRAAIIEADAVKEFRALSGVQPAF